MRRSIPMVFAGSFLGLGLLLPLPSLNPAPAAVTGSIVGTVRSAGTSPVSGVRVIAGNRYSAVTAADGGYRIDGVPQGLVEVHVRSVGYQPASDTVRVVSGGTVRLDFTLVASVLRLEESVATVARDAASVSLPFSIGQVQSRSVPRGRFNTEDYNHIVDNPWRSPERDPLSTFSTDVDAASYSNIRRFLGSGTLAPRDAVRIEEMINYFRYDYAEPRGGDPVSVTTEVAAAPWNASHKLVLIGLQTRRIPMEELPPNNLVFLLDVSGSMQPANKLPLVKSAFRLLVDQLRPQDRVSLVVYAGATGLVLPPTAGSDKERILDALQRLEAGGTTAGGAGLQLAYKTARETYLEGGNNRVILATDGDFNVGPSSDAEMIRLIEAEREHGVFLTVLGFGMGNLKDAKLEQIADKGNGHYAYVDNLMEARKIFVQELGATLLTVAKDVKLQIEFNPRKVAAYRLVGYENRLLANEDFNDDTKDAGELGAGHAVTALYEIVPTGVPLDVPLGSVDPLRYQDDAPPSGGPMGGGAGEWLTVKIRYKPPTGARSLLLSHVVRGEVRPSENFRWAAAVAGVGMLLRNSAHKGNCSWPALLDLARGARGRDREGYRAEFLRLAETAQGLTASR